MKVRPYVRVYLNISTGRLSAIEYADSNAYTVFEDKNIYEVFEYNYIKKHVPTMSELKEEIMEKLVNIIDR